MDVNISTNNVDVVLVEDDGAEPDGTEENPLQIPETACRGNVKHNGEMSNPSQSQVEDLFLIRNIQINDDSAGDSEDKAKTPTDDSLLLGLSADEASGDWLEALDFPGLVQRDSEESFESLESFSLPFMYKDLDELEEELVEIYAVYEFKNFRYCQRAFLDFREKKVLSEWATLSRPDILNVINDILDDLEVCDHKTQFDALLALNYLVQGSWEEYETSVGQMEAIYRNVMFFIQCDAFNRIWSFMKSYLLQVAPTQYNYNEKVVEASLNILCTITTVVLGTDKTSNTNYVMESFISELRLVKGESVLLLLFTSVVEIGEKNFHCFLLKKLLLLIKNLLLLLLGGSKELKNLKVTCRQKAGLMSDARFQDTISTCHSIEPLQNCWGKLIDSGRSFPWTPKASLEALRACRLSISEKLNGKLGDLDLPKCMSERLISLTKHLYVPLGDFQKVQEELIAEHPYLFEQKESVFVEDTDRVFTMLISILEPVIETLVQILTEATPRTVIRPYNPFIPRLHDLKRKRFCLSVHEDSRRQAEIVAKTISSILLLLLKHTKLNHIYQFEWVASLIVQAIYIPNCLRFFSRDAGKYIYRNSKISMDSKYKFKLFTSKVSTEEASLETPSSHQLSWRNMFTCVNLLRILNKVVKGKPNRIEMLVTYRAQKCLWRLLKIPDSVLQQYALKILKCLYSRVPRDWKKKHLYIVSAVSRKVRHRMLVDWVGDSFGKHSRNKRKKDEASLKVDNPWEFYHIAEEQLHRTLQGYLNRRFEGKMTQPTECMSAAGAVDSFQYEIPKLFRDTGAVA